LPSNESSFKRGNRVFGPVATLNAITRVFLVSAADKGLPGRTGCWGWRRACGGIARPSIRKAEYDEMVRSCAAVSATLIAGFVFHATASAAPLAQDGALSNAGLTDYWSLDVPLQRGESLERAFLLDDALYLTTDRGTVFAVQADTGLVRWAARLVKPAFEIRRPFHPAGVGGDRYVLIPTSTTVFLIDRYSGDIIRKLNPDWAVSSPVAGLGNALFMGAMNGHMYCLIWRPDDMAPPAIRWEVDVGSPVVAAPVLFDGPRLLTTTQDGRVFSCYASDKQFDWSFRAGGPILGDPVVENDSVYVSSMDRVLYRLDADSGWTVWQARFPDPLAEGPLVAGNVAFQYCRADGLTAVDADTGAKVWRVDEGRTVAAHLGDRDVVFTRDRALLAVEHVTGDVLGRVECPDAFAAVPNVKTNATLLMARDGRILCAKPKEVPYVRHEEVAAARARLNQAKPVRTDAAEDTTDQETERQLPVRDDPFRSRDDLAP
jgi:outer membrane protein assembly factor BamB